MAHNLVFPTTYVNYCEIGQGSNTKFSGIVREANNTYLECFVPCKCRDYLPDSFTYAKAMEVGDYDIHDMGIYGFYLNNSAPLWTKSSDGYYYMKIQSKDPKELAAIKRHIPALTTYFGNLNPYLGKITRVVAEGTVTKDQFVEAGKQAGQWPIYTNGGSISQVGYLILKIHKNWFSSVTSVSLYTELLRALGWAGYYGWFADNAEVTFEQIIKKVRVEDCSNERTYFQSIFNNRGHYNYELMFENWDKIFTTLTGIPFFEYNMEQAKQLDTDNVVGALHNNSGIIASVNVFENAWTTKQEAKALVSSNGCLVAAKVMIRSKYHQVLGAEMQNGSSGKYWEWLKKSFKPHIEEEEVLWDKWNEGNLWATVRAKYADLPTL